MTMGQEKKPIQVRLAEVETWVEQKRQEEYKKHVNDRKADTHHVFALHNLLSSSAYCLRGFFEEVNFNPKSAMRDERTIEHISMIDILLPRLERWMRGELSEYQLSNLTYEYCKNRVLSGSLSRMNCTSMMVNLFDVYENNNYCTIVKAIDSSAVAFLEHKQGVLAKELAEATAGTGKRAKKRS